MLAALNCLELISPPQSLGNFGLYWGLNSVLTREIKRSLSGHYMDLNPSELLSEAIYVFAWKDWATHHVLLILTSGIRLKLDLMMVLNIIPIFLATLMIYWLYTMTHSLFWRELILILSWSQPHLLTQISILGSKLKRWTLRTELGAGPSDLPNMFKRQ